MLTTRTRHARLRLHGVFEMIEQVAAHGYPNPLRVDCPSKATIERFASNPKAFPIKDPLFDHLARCSPCFRLVLAHRQSSDTHKSARLKREEPADD